MGKYVCMNVTTKGMNMKRNVVQKAVTSVVVAVVFTVLAAAQNGDRVSIPLTDPNRPVNLRVSLLNGSITIKAYEGKEVQVEARTRGGEKESTHNGMRKVPLLSSGLSAEEEDNQVKVGVESFNKTVDLV